MPAGAGTIRAGQAYVELMLRNRIPLGLKKAAAQLKAFGATVSAMGTRLIAWGSAVAAPLLATTKVFASMGDDAIKMSKRTGLPVEALSQLKYAADLSGTSIEDVEKAVKRMQMSMIDAARGSKEVTDTFQMLGLNVKQLEGMSPEEQFITIAEAISRVPNASTKAGLALKLFGRSGSALLPLMEQGAKGVRALMAEADRLGLTITTDEAKAAAKFRDDMTRLWAVVKKAAFTIGSALAPAISEVAGHIRDWVANVSKWLKQNKELVVVVMKAAVAVVGLGIGMFVLGKIIAGLGGILMVLSVAVKAAGIAISVLGSIIGFLVTPIGLVIAALATIVGAWLWWSGTGKAAVDTVRKAWSTLADDVGLAKQGIVDALMAGDIGLAAKILWLTIKLEGQRALLFLKSLWWKFKTWCLEVWYGMQAAWLTVTNAITVALIEGVGLMKQGWASFEGYRKSAVSKFGHWMAKQWVKIKGMFDESVDVQAQVSYIDDQARQDAQRIDRETDARKKSADQWTKDARKALDVQYQQDLAKVGDKAKAADDEYAKAVEAGEKEIADARAALAAAVDEAARKRRALAEEKDKARGEYAIPEFDMGARMQEVESKREVRGLFSPARLAGLAAASPIQERIAVATEKTAENTEDIVREIADQEGAVYE